MDRPRHRPLLAVVVIAGVASATAAHAQTATGTMNVHLGPSPGRTLTQSSLRVVNSSIGFDGTLAEGPGTGPFPVTNLPVANSYNVTVNARASSGEACVGQTSGIPVVENGTTIVFVGLACFPFAAAPIPALGRFAPLLGLGLAVLGAIAFRRRAREGRWVQ